MGGFVEKDIVDLHGSCEIPIPFRAQESCCRWSKESRECKKLGDQGTSNSVGAGEDCVRPMHPNERAWNL